MNRYKENRDFLKANFQLLDEIKTDRQKGLPFPKFQKGYDVNGNLIDLPKVKKKLYLNLICLLF